MGLPIRRLILASNENDVLDELFRSGRYRTTKPVVATSSPSMDISKASNFERYVFDLVGRDGARVRTSTAASRRGRIRPAALGQRFRLPAAARTPIDCAPSSRFTTNSA